MGNSSVERAFAAFKIEVYQARQTELENEMDGLFRQQASNPTSTDIQEKMYFIRRDLNTARAAIGLWRGEESFWNQEINENKTSGKEGNKLASNA